MKPLMRISLVVLLTLAVCGCANRAAFEPRDGDLLFQDLDGHPLTDAIEKVTEGCCGANFSHVGIVVVRPTEEAAVLEAVGDGVRTTPLDKFLARSHDAQGRPKVLVGRLRRRYRSLIPRALAHMHTLLGEPYDSVFRMDNGAYYCSELIYVGFLRANGGKPLFRLAPMTFKDPDTGRFFPAWVNYYKKLNTAIPEGEQGCNPGGMSRSPAIEIIHAYGRPSGYQGPPISGGASR